MKLIHQWFERFKSFTDEIFAKVKSPGLLEAFDGADETVDEPGCKFSRIFDLDV